MGIPAPQGVAASGIPLAGDAANAVLSGVFTVVGPSQPFAFRGPMNLALWAQVTTALTTAAGSLAATIASATGIAAGYAINSVNVPKGTTVGALAVLAVTLAIPPITLPGKINVNAAAITDIPDTTGLLGATVTGPGLPVAGATVLAITTASIAPTNLSPGQTGSVQLSAPPTLTTPDRNLPQQFTYARTGNAITTTGADAAATFTGSGVNFTGSVQLERSFDGGSTWLIANIGGGGTLAIWTAGTPINIAFGEPEKNVLYRLNCTALSAGNISYRISQTGGAAESLAIGQLV